MKRKMVRRRSRRAFSVNPRTQRHEERNHDDDVITSVTVNPWMSRKVQLTCGLRWSLTAAAVGVEGGGGRDFREAPQ